MEEEGELCFPQMPNRSCRLPRVEPSESLVYSLILGSLSVLVTVLNLLVILSICCFRQLQTSTNQILLSLACSDFLLGLVVIPVSFWTWGRCWTWGEYACTSYYFFIASLQIATLYTVVLISVDRYVAVMDPMRYRTRMSTCNVRISIGATWCYAVLFCFITMNGMFAPDKPVRCLGECTITVLVEGDLILGLMLPLLIIIGLYARILSVVVAKIQTAQLNCTSHVSDKMKVKQMFELKAAKNLGIVVAVHLLCLIPYYSTSYSTGGAIDTGGNVSFYISGFLLFLNSLINPIIYVLIYPKFRKAFKIIITLKILCSGPVLQ
ncbi:hypothetical protein WMY93_014430 [Mugilogobius chulae]|uniref:G-protein coupled receptors family 1 profile domain-containing protein n=1 Tax=Mugilogobius chulae TaxID=88201 RepID=A0AAW0P4F3_9GOBI